MIINILNNKSFTCDLGTEKYKIDIVGKNFFLCKKDKSPSYYQNYFRIYDFLNYGIFRSDTGLVFKNLIAGNDIGTIQFYIRKMLKYNQIL